MTRIQKAMEILQKTNDGNDLSPKHLSLVQRAVNNHINDAGLQAFDELYQQVQEGTYKKVKAYLHGVEHMTKDHKGCVYYKGQEVEHFSHNNTDKEKRRTYELAKICRLLEEKGHPIDSITASWKIKDYLTPEEIATCENVEAEMAQSAP